jgi:hypothetical protein
VAVAGVGCHVFTVGASQELTTIAVCRLYLRRPPAQHEQYRLDRILKRKAEQGVRIFVQVYKVRLLYTLTVPFSTD